MRGWVDPCRRVRGLSRGLLCASLDSGRMYITNVQMRSAQ